MELPDLSTAFASSLDGARRVVVIGGYGCGNIGDEAILSVLLHEPALATRDVCVVSRNPYETTRLHGVPAIAARPKEIARSIVTSDALVLGGGGIFSGYMGRRSMLLPALALAASAARKRVLYRALGVYSSTPPLVGRMLARSMARSHFVSVRDAPSVAALDAFGLRQAPMIEPDPALRLRAQPFDGDLPRRPIGLALRRVRDRDVQRHLTDSFAALISALAAEGRTPVLLPFSQHPSERLEQDELYLRRLRDVSDTPSAVVLAGLAPGQMLGVIGSLDALVAMRFHGIVFGHVAGTPTLAIEYDEKCGAFARDRAIASISPADVNVERLSAGLSSLAAGVVAA